MQNFTSYVGGALAVVVIIGVLVLLALGLAVPVELWSAFALVLGFFFGNQAGQGAATLRK